jgi:L-ascorbate metabolism protein UlaG (beta-lactamase superfamily)
MDIDLIGRIDALEVGGRSLAFWGLGQVGVAIKGPTGVVYVDPYLTDSDGEGGSLPRTFPAASPRRGHQRLGRTADPRPHRPHRPGHRIAALRSIA